MENYRSFDPYRQTLLAVFPTDDSVDFPQLQLTARQWRATPVQERSNVFLRLSALLQNDRYVLAQMISMEMGKPLQESLFEIDKCISAIRMMCEMAPALLKAKPVRSEAKTSYLLPEPFGILLGVMPWNFPWWQVIRFALPALLAGNTVVIKPAPNVPQCAKKLEEHFLAAGFPEGVLTVRFLSNNGVAQLVRHPLISGVAFTGSDSTGEIIGGLCGQALKKSVMELGGNDPMIVFDDADLDEAVNAAVQSRCINGGQACNGAKRFLVAHSIHDQFVHELNEKVRCLKTGNPLDPSTHIGPIARFDLLEKVRSQVGRAVAEGARLVTTGELIQQSTWFFTPTVLAEVLPGNTAFEEEIFGPVWSVTSFTDREDALRLSNLSRYGLGVSLWTNDDALIEWMTPRLETGNVFINDFVRSDARFPFGGVKRSGYGKELGEAGLFEFVNWKTVYRRS